MSKIKIDPNTAQRLSAFIASRCFTVLSSEAKSDYWKYYSSQLLSEVEGSSVSINGDSGFYVPQASTFGRRLLNKFSKVIKQPSKIVNKLKNLVNAQFGVPRLVPFDKAFDMVMGHAELSDPILSPYRIDHCKLAKNKNVFATMKAVSDHYKSWSPYNTSDSIVTQYYHQNILRGYVDNKDIKTIMEIGAGNGNLPSILFHTWDSVRFIIVDLPETLAVAIPFLAELFPNAKMLMPHEMQADSLKGKFDFAFLTVDQIDLIGEDTIDLAINCDSFQEMTKGQIKTYFDLIQRVTRDSGYFFTDNRVEKIPGGPDSFQVVQAEPPNRFDEYPWNSKNETLVYEISSYGRLVQLDDSYIRLQRIHK